MKTSLKSIVAGTVILGMTSINTGCLTQAMSRAIVTHLAVHTAKETISHEVNPNETNVNVYNSNERVYTNIPTGTYICDTGICHIYDEWCDYSTIRKGSVLFKWPIIKEIREDGSFYYTPKKGYEWKNPENCTHGVQQIQETKKENIRDCIRIDEKVYCEQ